MKKMKVLACMLLGFGLLFTACSDDDTSGAKGNGGSANVRISLYASDALSVRSTYNSSSNLGGATNLVNTTSYYFRYILAVYDAGGSEVVKETQVVDVGTGATTFEVELTNGEEYTAVGWCDFVTSSGDDAADNHYDTTGFPEISCKDIAINDESYDAYYASESFTAMSEGTKSLTLKRPFAKLRLVATNWTTKNAPDAISITYDGLSRYTTFNAKDGSVSGASSTATYSATTIPTYDESESVTLLVDYILVGSDAQTVSISYDATQNGTSVGSKTVADVPLQRNYLTTVSGKALNSTDEDEDNNNEDTDVTVNEGINVDDGWDGNYDVAIEDETEEDEGDDETNEDETTIETYNDITAADYSSAWLATDGSSAQVLTDDNGDSYLLVTTSTGGRADLKFSASEAVVLDPAEAPILCFRITDVNDDGYDRNITIDTSGNLVSDGTKYSGGLGGNNNQWSVKYECEDGTALLVYDLTEKTLTNGSTSTSEVLPSACSFGTFQIKYADIKQDGSSVQVSYKFYWFKSFASMEDMATYLDESGITYTEAD